MNLSDLNQDRGAPSPSDPRRALGTAADTIEAERWRDAVDSIGSDVAQTLTSALDRLHDFVVTGHIDGSELRALHRDVEQARQAGIIAQQMARYGSGRIRLSAERLSLAETVNEVLAHRARDTHLRDVSLKAPTPAADVLIDPALLSSLLNNLLDWSLAFARSPIEFSIDVKSWPSQARLLCRFQHQPEDEVSPLVASDADDLDSLQWRLVEHAALTLGLTLARSLDNGKVYVALDFPRTINDAVDGVSSIELDDGFAMSTGAKPLAGSHVLVIASRRQMRLRVRNAIRHMGMLIDLVASIEEAAEFCREGKPHAIIFEGILKGEKFNRLRREIGAELPNLPFIEIAEEGTAFEMSTAGNAQMGHVGREAIESALPSVLTFELSRAMM